MRESFLVFRIDFCLEIGGCGAGIESGEESDSELGEDKEEEADVESARMRAIAGF